MTQSTPDTKPITSDLPIIAEMAVVLALAQGLSDLIRESPLTHRQRSLAVRIALDRVALTSPDY